jgi:hypothetical protein
VQVQPVDADGAHQTEDFKMPFASSACLLVGKTQVVVRQASDTSHDPSGFYAVQLYIGVNLFF